MFNRLGKILIVGVLVVVCYLQYRTIDALRTVGSNQYRIYEVMKGMKYWPEK